MRRILIAGLTNAEAAALENSPRPADADWSCARA
jgi:hypothetical protein